MDALVLCHCFPIDSFLTQTLHRAHEVVHEMHLGGRATALGTVRHRAIVQPPACCGTGAASLLIVPEHSQIASCYQ